MNLSSSLRWRYATKKFDPQRVVPEPIVETILEAGNLAATSFGLQPFQFVVVRDQQLQDQLVPFSWGQAQIADASHVIVIAARTDLDEAFVENFIQMAEGQLGLPAGKLAPYQAMIKGSLSGMNEDQRLQWASKQTYIALGKMMAACATLEIDSCPMEGFNPVEYNRLLGLESKNLFASVLLPIGYRAEDDDYQFRPKIRRPLADMVVRIGQ